MDSAFTVQQENYTIEFDFACKYILLTLCKRRFIGKALHCRRVKQSVKPSLT